MLSAHAQLSLLNRDGETLIGGQDKFHGVALALVVSAIHPCCAPQSGPIEADDP